ncbi:hypothetical protein [Methyloceanibacter sp.]|uniref:hypothetical protein n=1 Tax=Methyloceanibacter sp. TaxID=1965321 RepID=UPI003D6D9755
MRDIRNDLAERARLIEDQISAAYAQFEKMLEQLQNERDGKVSDLKAEFTALGKLMEVENRRMANVLPLAVQGPTQQMSLADFIMHTLNEIGPMSKDDIVDLASKEGYFSDAENADRGVHAALVSLHRNEHLRQLQDGNFAPATLAQTVRFRRAM